MSRRNVFKFYVGVICMKDNKVCYLDLVVMSIGILLIVVIKNATRFIGVGILSLAFTYYMIDRYNIMRKLK